MDQLKKYPEHPFLPYEYSREYHEIAVPLLEGINTAWTELHGGLNDAVQQEHPPHNRLTQETELTPLMEPLRNHLEGMEATLLEIKYRDLHEPLLNDLVTVLTGLLNVFEAYRTALFWGEQLEGLYRLARGVRRWARAEVQALEMKTDIYAYGLDPVDVGLICFYERITIHANPLKGTAFKRHEQVAVEVFGKGKEWGPRIYKAYRTWKDPQHRLITLPANGDPAPILDRIDRLQRIKPFLTKQVARERVRTELEHLKNELTRPRKR